MDKLFDGQHDDETVLLVFRRHVIALRKGLYGILVPLAISSIPVFIWQTEIWPLWGALGGFGLGLILFFYHWVGWYFSIFIITDQRIRQVSQKGLFGKTVIDLGLPKIQNISYNIPGFSGEVLGFGTIVIQTYVGDLVLDKLHHPDRIYNVLLGAVKEVSADVNLNTHEQVEA